MECSGTAICLEILDGAGIHLPYRPEDVATWLVKRLRAMLLRKFVKRGVIVGLPGYCAIELLERRIFLDGSVGSPTMDVAAASAILAPYSLTSSTGVSASANPLVYGRSVTFSAMVVSVVGGGTPTGTVQFSLNGRVLGSPVKLVNGLANSIVVSALPVGSHNIGAAYSGDANFRPSSGGLVLRVLVPSDTSAPSPNPSTWAESPRAVDPTQITMLARTASDVNEVEYKFDCLTGGGHDSDWQSSPRYTDTDLLPGRSYTYQVVTRDKSIAQNTGLASIAATATTPLATVSSRVLRILGSSGADQISLTLSGVTWTVRQGDNTQQFTAGIDAVLIDGGAGPDTINVGPGIGRVTVYGSAGSDTITGGSLADLIYGGDNEDIVDGGGGADTIYGNSGNDRVSGGIGRDSMMAGLGDDTVSGDSGSDLLFSGDGMDYVYGGPEADYIEGRGKADTIYGGDGNDTIHGGAGADEIYGEAGDDHLYASASTVFSDTINGGTGVDRYEADADDVLSAVELPLIS